MRFIVTAVVLCMLSLDVMAQGEISKGDKPSFKERLYFSLSPQLAIGNGFTQIGLSPSVGVMITPRFSSGVGGTYIYQKQEFFDAVSLYGGRLFSRFNFTESLFAYTEYQKLTGSNAGEKINIDSNFYAGAGLFERISDRAGFQVLALYNLLDETGGQSPWVFRAGLTYSPF